uniref:Amidohydrolase n=1 Tax=Ignisphaera aggregans TaxID=334771 RepID=A0A7C5YU74_9CREN
MADNLTAVIRWLKVIKSTLHWFLRWVSVEIVDKIVVGRYVVTLDSFNRVIPKGAIAIKDGVVVDVGEYNDVRNRYRADEVIERLNHIIMPGLVDCHVHTQQYLLRSAITDEMLQLPPIWTRVLVPFENMMSLQLARISTQASIVNMLRNGITYFIEAGAPYPEILTEEVARSGVKGVITYATYNVLEDRSWDAKEVLKKAEVLYREWNSRNNVRIWMSIRQVMMASEDLVERVIEFAKKFNTGLTLHLAEYQGEVDYILTKYGKRPLEHLLEKELKSIKPVVIAHGVFLSPREIEIVKKFNLGICWCPTVDSWLMGIHWVCLKDVDNMVIGIGSDGGAWNRLDLLHEAKVAKAIAKAVNNAVMYYKAGLDSQTLLDMLAGSRGVITGERIGRLEKGYSADLIVLNIKYVGNLPLHNPIDLVVNYLEGDSVSDVIIDGKFVVKEGKVLTIDEEKIVEEVLNRENEVEKILNELMRNLKLS